MDKINISKITNYDKFKCTADKCSFTCCEGWDINIDDTTYTKWSNINDETNNMLKNVKVKKSGKKTAYFINKETHEACPFLDNKGLCHIVKNHGEDYLSLTCHLFPRIENVFKEAAQMEQSHPSALSYIKNKELTLSCACPEVVELISEINGKINMIGESTADLKSNLPELKIREALISIMGHENILTEHKLIACFEMLLTIAEDKSFKKGSLSSELAKYKSMDYVKNLTTIYNEIKLNKNDSMEELSNLFLDIIQNYKDVPALSYLLNDISDFGESIRINKLSPKWEDYKKSFDHHKILIENCIISKIFSSCVSNGIEEMTLSLQMIILEYLLVRYAVFLKCCLNNSKEANLNDIKIYISAFSRIIGNNSEAVIEFLSYGFGKPVLDKGYLYFIALF